MREAYSDGLWDEIEERQDAAAAYMRWRKKLPWRLMPRAVRLWFWKRGR